MFVDGDAAAIVPACKSSSMSAIGADLLRRFHATFSQAASACEDDEDELEEREVESLIFATEDESERKENVNDGCVVTARSEEAEGSQRKVLKVTKTKTKTKKRSGGKSISMSVEAEGTVSNRFILTIIRVVRSHWSTEAVDKGAHAQGPRSTAPSPREVRYREHRPTPEAHPLVRRQPDSTTLYDPVLVRTLLFCPMPRLTPSPEHCRGKLPQAEFSQEQNTSTAN